MGTRADSSDASPPGSRCPLNLAAALLIFLTLAPGGGAAAGDSVAQCHGYARQAVEQARENVNKKCGYTGNAWGDYYDGHFKFCRSAKSSSVDREVKARVDALNLCNACRGYAQQAIDQARFNRDNKCGNTGNRWGDYYEGHFNFCKSARKSTTDAEVKARTDALNRCNGCVGYGRQAVAQAQENINNRCGNSGNRWGTYYEGHLQWCMSVKKSTMDGEVKARTDALNHCRGCRGYADHANYQQSQNVARKCYMVGPAWQNNFDAHMRFCQAAKKSSVDRETKIRNDGLRKCGECQGYANHALQQREQLIASGCSGMLYGGRWGDYWFGHYQYCMGSRESSIDWEVAARNEAVDACKKGTPITRQRGAPGQWIEVASPPAPKPTASECKVSVVITAEKCCQATSPPGTCVEMELNLAPGASTFGCHKDEQTALAMAVARWNMQEGAPAPDLDDDEDGVPCQGCCLMEKKVVQGCALCQGAFTRSYSPTPSAPAPSSKTGAPSAPSKKAGKPCTGGQLGTQPNCYCPKGTRLLSSGSTRRCVKIAEPTPAKPPKSTPAEPPKAPPERCPPNKPIGTPPNCRAAACPPGTTGIRPFCMPLKEDKKEKPKKEKPKKEKPKRDCGPGYRELDKPNKYGAYCEEIAPAKCPAGWTGTPPACQPPAPPPPPPPPPPPDPVGPSPKCAPPRIGTPPNCVCKPGFSGDDCSFENPK